MTEFEYIRNFSKQVSSNQAIEWKSKKGKILQSSVALILKPTPETFKCIKTALGKIEEILSFEDLEKIFSDSVCNDAKFEILYLRRKVNSRDTHSGQICFPGGRCDDDEDDFQASKRELFEETGIDLNTTKNLYLGRIPRNFDMYMTKRGQLKVAMHVFLYLKDYVSLILQESEIMDFRWIPFDLFLNTPKDVIAFKNDNFSIRDRIIAKISNSWYSKFIPSKILSNFVWFLYEGSSIPAFNIGIKNEVLYGMTLIFTALFINIALFNMKDQKSLNSKRSLKIHMEDANIGIRYIPFGKLICKKWYINNRAKLSEYPQSKSNGTYFFILISLIVIIASFILSN